MWNFVHFLISLSRLMIVVHIFAVKTILKTFQTSLYNIAILKVATLKRTALPRIDLCGTLIASRLARRIIESSRHSFPSVFHWTNSTLALGWIKTLSHLKTFVSNRLAKIQSKANPENWRHINGNNNPAVLLLIPSILSLVAWSLFFGLICWSITNIWFSIY